MIDRILSDATAKSAAESLDFAAVAARLNSLAQPTRKGIEAARFTWVGLQKHLSEDLYLSVRTKLKIASRQTAAQVEAIEAAGNAKDQNGVPTLAYVQSVGIAESIQSLFDSLAAGTSFSDEKTQTKLDTLSTILSVQEIEALKALGFTPAVVVTSSECQSAWETHEAVLASQRLAARRSAIVAALDHARELVGDELPTLDSVVAVIAANWPEGGE